MNWRRRGLLVPMVVATLIALSGCFIGWRDDGGDRDRGGNDHHGDHHEGGGRGGEHGDR